MATSKVLVVGAVQGQLDKAFQKVTKLHAKQNFSFAIVVGDLFAGESTEQSAVDLQSLLNGSNKVPLPTYFTIGDSSLPEAVRESIEANGEVCNNLFYLGRKGTLKTSEGVRIVNVGGRLVQNQASLTTALTNYDPLFLDTDANAMRGVNQADILITNQWPARININSGTPLPDNVDPELSSDSLARLCTALRPRYYFSSSPQATSKWEREPFLHPKSYEDSEQNTDVTRFVSLSSINASAKDWMYAFTLDLSQPPKTDGAQVISPLTFSPKRKRPSNDELSSNYSRFDNSSSHQSGRNYRNRNKRTRYDPDDCFMCMGRPGFNTDMVVSIADESFLTILKGPLPLRGTTFSALQSSGHTMIIPMFHAASETSSSKRSLSELETEFTDMTKYRHSLNSMMSSHGLGAVTWEVNRTGIRHMHWQHIGALSPMTKSNGLIAAAYKVAAEKAQYPTFQPCDPDTLLPDQRADFFRVWIFEPGPNPQHNPQGTSKTPIEAADATANGHDDADNPTTTGTERSMWFPIDAKLKFNISFGREVMAGLLQLEDRSDWRSIPEGGEEQDAEAMKADFGPFDAAMQ